MTELHRERTEFEPELAGVSSRRVLRVGGFTVAGRRRRPSGEQPPLPGTLDTAGRAWLVTAILVVGVWITVIWVEGTADWWNERDEAVVRWVVDLRSDAATSVMNAIHALGSEWLTRTLRWVTLVVLVGFRRWRSLLIALGVLITVEVSVATVGRVVGRPRPFVDIIGEWDGFAHPSGPVASLAVTLAIVGLTLIPAGAWRRRYWRAATAAVVLLGISRLYLGVDHPTDVLVGAAFAVAVTVVAFRWYRPETVYPVTYRRASAAHVDVAGPRGDAIKQAVRDQLGLEIEEVRPTALEGSAGSTPLKLTGAGEAVLFGKLYTRGHLRSDRWYKAARMVLYGALEDEVEFSSVRRLVEYEDYVLRLSRDEGVRVPEPHGLVEIAPEREYLILMEFCQRAVELGEADITDVVMHNALALVRKLWYCGLAHRDIKPSNLMVQGEQVVLIDVAFATVRPSPWRQAVDLANMMLVLGLKRRPQEVYAHAVHHFSPDDIAEAFAASRGVTIPSQLRRALRERQQRDGIDVAAEFRALAPYRESIAIQRWSPRRLALAARLLVVGLVVAWLILRNVQGGGIL